MDFENITTEKLNDYMGALTDKVRSGTATNNPVLKMFDMHATSFFKNFEDGKKMTTDLCDVARYTFDGPHKKRIRPLLTFYAGMCVYRDARVAFLCLHYAFAVELVHTYSLIHDDLPCMDNALKRRGKDANHIVYGDANALLAGNWLLAHAFKQSVMRTLTHDTFANTNFDDYDLLDDDIPTEIEKDANRASIEDFHVRRRDKIRNKKFNPSDNNSNNDPDVDDEALYDSHSHMGEVAIEAQSYLISAVHRMIDGQALDKQYTLHRPDLDREEILHLHMLKTAALMQAAVLGAATISETIVEDEQQKALRYFAKHFGLAFQIADDIDDFDKDNPHPTNICTHLGPKASFEEFKNQKQAARKALKSNPSYEALGVDKLLSLLNDLRPKKDIL